MTNLHRPSTLKTLGLALLLALAGISAYLGAVAVYTEVQTYRALKTEHTAILKYLGESIATQKDKDGKDMPINRPMVLDMIIAQALKAAEQAAPAPSPTPPK